MLVVGHSDGNVGRLEVEDVRCVSIGGRCSRCFGLLLCYAQWEHIVLVI